MAELSIVVSLIAPVAALFETGANACGVRRYQRKAWLALTAA